MTIDFSTVPVRKHWISKKMILELSDLISQFRCILEFEITRVLIHLIFQFLQLAVQLFGAELIVLAHFLGYPVGAPDTVIGATGVTYIHHIGYLFANSARRNLMQLVIGELLVTAPIGFTNGPLNRTGYLIRIEYCSTINIACRAADSLYQ